MIGELIHVFSPGGIVAHCFSCLLTGCDDDPAGNGGTFLQAAGFLSEDRKYLHRKVIDQFLVAGAAPENAAHQGQMAGDEFGKSGFVTRLDVTRQELWIGQWHCYIGILRASRRSGNIFVLLGDSKKFGTGRPVM